MIRVCLVAPKYMTGGQAIEARQLVNGFAEDPNVRVELQPIDPKIPAWIARLKGVRTVARMPLYLAGLVRRIHRADVVHVCTAAFSPFILTTTPAIVLGLLLGRPVLLNYRDGRAADHLPTRWVRWVLGRCTLLLFPSGFLRDLFARFGLKGEVVYNVVDTARFRFRHREPLRPVLLSCRLLEQLYAVENTLRAFALVRERYPEARLMVVGGGDQEEALKAIVREEGIEGVEFIGPVAHGEIPEWMDRADVFVNSSREDNMPHSVIEAFASGLPVVTTRAGGIPYIVQDGSNGLLVDIDSPPAMAEAVLRLLDDPSLARRLVDQAERDCRERYSWEAARQGWTMHYRRLAGARHSAASLQASARVE